MLDLRLNFYLHFQHCYIPNISIPEDSYMQNIFDQNHTPFASLIACLDHAHCCNTHGPFNFKLFQFESETRVRVKLGTVAATKAWIQMSNKLIYWLPFSCFIYTTFFILYEYSKWKEVHWKFLSCVIVRLVIL